MASPFFPQFVIEEEYESQGATLHLTRFPTLYKVQYILCIRTPEMTIRYQFADISISAKFLRTTAMSATVTALDITALRVYVSTGPELED